MLVSMLECVAALDRGHVAYSALIKGDAFVGLNRDLGRARSWFEVAFAPNPKADIHFSFIGRETHHKEGLVGRKIDVVAMRMEEGWRDETSEKMNVDDR